MPSDVREYLRAAQAAEIRGDKARAIDFLHKAADLYENAGNRPRAQQMLRQIDRLQAAPSTVVQADGGARAARAVPSGGIQSFEQDNRDASSAEFRGATQNGTQISSPEAAAARHARRERRRPARPELFQRGPTLADPALEAWCSFCCRPGKEVGALIAGPAGAYVCRGCAQESMRLLGNENAEPSGGRGLEREFAQLITRIARQAVRPRRGLRKKRTKKRRSK
jgi:hypothetical protein